MDSLETKTTPPPLHSAGDQMPEKPFCPRKHHKQPPAVLNILQNLGKNRFFFFQWIKLEAFILQITLVGEKPVALLGHEVFIMLLLLMITHKNKQVLLQQMPHTWLECRLHGIVLKYATFKNLCKWFSDFGVNHTTFRTAESLNSRPHSQRF